MRKTKRNTLDIGGKEHGYTVLEVTVQLVLDLFEELTTDELGLEAFYTKMDEHLKLFVEGLTLDDFKRMAPSEIETVWEDWREVNAAFFRMASFMELDQLLGRLKEAIMMDFYGQLCTLLAGGTNESGTTAGTPS